MNTDLISIMICPECKHPKLDTFVFKGDNESLVDALLYCEHCKSSFVIENSLLEMLPASICYKEHKEQFFKKYEQELLRLPISLDEQSSKARQINKDILAQQEHFDWYCDNETQTYTDYENTPFWRSVDADILGRWKDLFPPKARVLEIGCAQGRSTFQIMDRDIDIVAFDISKKMIAAAQARYDTTKPKAKATFFVGDATSLPFQDGSFDAVMIYGVLHHLPSPGNVCAEVARILRPGGHFFASENNKSKLRAIFDTLQKMLPLWHEEAGEQPLLSREDFTTWLGKDFTIERCFTHVFIPPHVVNMLGYERGGWLLRATDALFQALPYAGEQGGLITLEAKRR